MGNEGSREEEVPFGPPETLKARTLDALVEYINSGEARKIVLMVGAGISTAAGIPDFRSPETGLYANLARLNLPYPEAVFDISFFRQNPAPFYALAHELYPGNYRPTLTHLFIRLLQSKGLLLKCFTQNIDCLEREAGVPDEAIVEAHGSFARQRCIECGTEFPDADMRRAVAQKEVPHCNVPECNGLVKPDIVFFGEKLPDAFFQSVRVPAEADLAIIIGTSLKVHPFAMLPQIVGDRVPRLLINKELVGGLGSRADDVCVLEECDEGVRKLVEKLGWMEELEELWKEKHGDEPMKKGEVAEGRDGEEEGKKGRDEALEDEIEKLTREIDESLKFSSEHRDWVKGELEKGKSDEATSEAEEGSRRSTKQVSGDEPKGRSTLPDVRKPPDGPTKSSDPKALRQDSEAEETKREELEHVFPHSESKASL